MTEVAEVVVSLRGVGVRVDGARLLTDVDLDLRAREHLAVLGPNGSGKTTLLRVVSTYRHPTTGTATVLGARFGATDLRRLRPRIGFVSTALDDLLHVRAAALPLVAAAVTGGLWPPPTVLDDPAVVAAAEHALRRVGAPHLAGRRVDTLSQGERQRVRIARALAPGPDLLLLDEPFAGLDMGGRESLLADLDAVLAEPDGPTVVLVTHHLEELPRGIRSVLLLREGGVVAAGPTDEVLTDATVSGCFDVAVRVSAEDGRFAARAVAATPPRPDSTDR